MFKEHALDLFNKGYTPIPLIPNTKRPAIKHWQHVIPTIPILNDWVTQFPDYGIGITTKNMPCVDIDILNEQEVNNVLLFIMQYLSIKDKKSLLIRTGKPPKILIPFKLENKQVPYNKMRIKTNPSPNSNEAIEILGQGQFAVFYGIHPDTNESYHLTSDLPNIQDLPVLNKNIVDGLVLQFSKDPKDNVLKPNNKQLPRGNPINVSENDIKHVLRDVHAFIPKPNHDQWLLVGMVLHYQFQGNSKGAELWKYFSKMTPETYNEEEINKRYDTFVSDINTSGYTLGSLKYLTKSHQDRLNNSKFIVT